MSYLISSGNLVGMPELRQSKSGTDYARARVIHNYREQDQAGEWRDSATIAYDLVVTGRRARQLIEAATVNGNIGIEFRGRYHVRTFERADGTNGIAHQIMVDSWSILPGQNVMIAKPPAPTS